MGIHIDGLDTLLGVSLIKVRNILRILNRGSTDDAFEIASRANVRLDPHVVIALLEEFRQLRLIESEIGHAGQHFNIVTKSGWAFLEASARKRVPAAHAKRLLDRIVDNVGGWATNPKFLYDISKIWVYGSYIRGSETVGDLDIVFERSIKPDFLMRADVVTAARSEGFAAIGSDSDVFRSSTSTKIYQRA